MIGRLVDPRELPVPDTRLALIRVAAIPVIVAGEQLVDHPAEHTGGYWWMVAAASLYAVSALVQALRARPLPMRLTAALDLAFLVGLVYTSGGPFSQARSAFFLVPVVTALVAGPRTTALASNLVVAAYIAISLIHPATDERPEAAEFELAQIGFLALVGVAATLLSSVLSERTRRVDQLAASRGRLVAQALDSEDRERRHLAEALHDEAVQNLLAAKQELAEKREAIDLELVGSAIDRTTAQLRGTMFELHPYLLEHGGLGPALRAVGDLQGERGGFEVDVEVDPAAEHVNDQLLFSVGRELLTNAAKHSEARHVRLAASSEGEWVMLEVVDDGRGMDPALLASAPLAGHIGLAACKERVEAVGGSLSVQGGPGDGVAVHVRIPAPEPREDDSEANVTETVEPLTPGSPTRSA